MRRWPWLAGGSVALALLVSVLAFETEPTPLAVADAGVVIVGEPVEVIVHSAELRSELPTVSTMPEDGYRYLLVEATISNTWSKPLASFGDLLALEGFDSKLDRLMYLDTGDLVIALQPRVPVTAQFVWQVPVDALDDGDDLRVLVNEQELFTEGLLDSEPRWTGPQAIAAVPFTVTVGSLRRLG